MKSITIAFFAILLFTACSKPVEPEKKAAPTDEEILSTEDGGESDEEIAARIIEDFGWTLKEGGTYNDALPTFHNYDSAATYINAIKDSVNAWADSTWRFAPPEIGGGLPCGSAGNYNATLEGTGGLFSNFNTSFSYNGTGVTSATVYVSGVPIAWSWNQLGSTFNGSSLSGCVWGQISISINVGFLTLVYSYAVNIRMTLNPSACTFTWMAGRGPC